MDWYEDELEQLLGESIDAAERRQSRELEMRARPYSGRLVLFGAGRLGRKLLAALAGTGLRVVALTDNNRALLGTKIDGVPVLAPAEAASLYGHRALFVVCIFASESAGTMQERIAELQALGCKSVMSFVPAMWKRPDILLPHWAVALPAEILKRADEIRRCARLFSEERSQREFLAQIRWRLHGDFSVLPPAAESAQYFAHDCFRLIDGEVFVDCGAFDGDTLKAFLEESRGRFERILCVEPDPKNFRRLTKLVGSLPQKIRRRIVCSRHAVATEGRVDAFLAAGDTSSRLGLGTDRIRCVSLDALLRDMAPSFLKFDIEGAEPDALKGARGIIERHSPVIAVCAYHTPEHLWELPLLIDAIRPGYCYFLRPYRQVWELVCYAAPLERASSPLTKVNVRRDAIMAFTDSTG